MEHIEIISEVERDPHSPEKLIGIKISNSAIILLKEYTNLCIQHQLGDVDDPSKVALTKEIANKLNEIWELLNPS